MSPRTYLTTLEELVERGDGLVRGVVTIVDDHRSRYHKRTCLVTYGARTRRAEGLHVRHQS